MKKLTSLTTISFCTLLAATPLKASDLNSDKTDQNIGFGSGLVIGAVAAGPIGAVIGAVSGAWLGEKVNEADKVDDLEQVIAENKQQLLTLQQTIIAKTEQLDAAQIQISNHETQQIKVAEEKNIISGINVDLMFRTNSSEIEQNALEKIVPLALLLEKFPEFELQLNGYSDKLGTKVGNKTISDLRLQAVKGSFVNAGISPERIHLYNASNNQATAELDDVEGRAFERKVSIHFIQSKQPASFASR